MDAERRVRLRITGRVQGVGYRMAAQREAERLGLAGWVRNAADGAVEAEAQGPEAAVEALVAWCAQGPRFARVAAVETAPIPPEPNQTAFRIR